MNITSEYFNVDENSDSFSNEENHRTILNNTVIINTQKRMDTENIWNFRLKFGGAGNQTSRVPVYENSPSNPSGDTNVAGFSFEGISYRPYNNNHERGSIVGWVNRTFEGEDGCVIQKQIQNVVSIEKIRVEIPKALIDSLRHFSNCLTLECDELSGFSKTFSTDDNNAVSFPVVFKDRNDNFVFFETTEPMYFHSSKNLQALTFKISDLNFDLSTNDTTHICYARINNRNMLEFVCSDIPSSFQIGDMIKTPSNQNIVPEIANDSELLQHDCFVIDGYIRNAEVIFRTLEGKELCRTKTDSNGRCSPVFKKTNEPVVVIATDGVDMSFYERNVVEFKTLIVPSEKMQLYVTPITTLFTDYVIFKELQSRATLSLETIREYIDFFEEKLDISNMFSDYISTKNLDAGKLSYQITSTIKVVDFTLEKILMKPISNSLLSLYLSKFIFDELENPEFDFENPDTVQKFVEFCCSKFNVDFNKYSKRLTNMSKQLAVHNWIDSFDSFDFLGKAALVLHLDIQETVEKSFNIFEKIYTKDEITDKRSLIVPKIQDSKYKNYEQKLFFDFSIQKTLSNVLNENLDKVSQILASVIVDYDRKDPKNIALATSTIEILEYDFGNDYTLGRSNHTQRVIEINSNFSHSKVENKFQFNNSICHPLLLFLLREVLKTIGCIQPNDEILSDVMKQSNTLSKTTLNAMSKIYEVDFNSIYITTTSSAKKITSDIKYISTDNYESELHFAVEKNPKLVKKSTNAPLFEKSNTVSIIDVNSIINLDGYIETVLVFSKSITGLCKYCVKIILNNEIEELSDVLTKKVGKNLVTVSITSYSTIQAILEKSAVSNFGGIGQNLKIDVAFYFGNFKDKFSIASSEFSIRNVNTRFALKDIEFMPHPIMSRPEMKRTFASNPNFTDELFVPELLGDSIDNGIDGMTPISSLNTITDTNIKYVKTTIMDTVNNQAWFVSANTLKKVDFASSTITTELTSITDLTMDSSNNIYVSTIDGFKILDSSGSSLSTVTGLADDAKIIAIALCETRNLVGVISSSKVYLYDVSDTSTPFSVAEYSDNNNLHKICFNDNSFYLISKTDSKLHKLEFNTEITTIESYDKIEFPTNISCDTTRNLLFVTSGHQMSIFDSSKETITKIHAIDLYGHIRDFEFVNNDTLLILDDSPNTALYTLKLYTDSDEFDFVSYPLEILLEGTTYDRFMYDEAASKIHIICGESDNTLKSFDASTILTSTGNIQDTSNLSLDFLNQKYEIQNIHREITGKHIIEVDKKFEGYSNINIDLISGISSSIIQTDLMNLDLQLNYIIDFNVDILAI